MTVEVVSDSDKPPEIWENIFKVDNKDNGQLVLYQTPSGRIISQKEDAIVVIYKIWWSYRITNRQYDS